MTANMLNGMRVLDNRLQYDFYRALVRPKRRFAKWVKTPQNDDAEILAKYYKISLRQARPMTTLIAKEAIAEMRKTISQGGIAK
jgi:acyl-CoA reductase-like NAD-dependent aldehyde dehydrogenase